MKRAIPISRGQQTVVLYVDDNTFIKLGHFYVLESIEAKRAVTIQKSFFEIPTFAGSTSSLSIKLPTNSSLPKESSIYHGHFGCSN